MAAYKSLLTVAEAGGHGAATGGLEANLAEEKATARWLDENIVSVTTKFLSSRSWRESQGLWEQRSSGVVKYQRIGPASLEVGLAVSLIGLSSLAGKRRRSGNGAPMHVGEERS
nr:ferritin-like domain-containing protein [Rhizobium leguminosarum]